MYERVSQAKPMEKLVGKILVTVKLPHVEPTPNFGVGFFGAAAALTVITQSKIRNIQNNNSFFIPYMSRIVVYLYTVMSECCCF